MIGNLNMNDRYNRFKLDRLQKIYDYFNEIPMSPHYNNYTIHFEFLKNELGLERKTQKEIDDFMEQYCFMLTMSYSRYMSKLGNLQNSIFFDNLLLSMEQTPYLNVVDFFNTTSKTLLDDIEYQSIVHYLSFMYYFMSYTLDIYQEDLQKDTYSKMYTIVQEINNNADMVKSFNLILSGIDNYES